MPNRFIKESICTSESIDGLSWFEEVFFYRLIVNCDDFGRFDARPAVLKSRLFPLKDRMTLKDVSNALTKLAEMGIVMLYECDGKPYLYLPTWLVHQTKRATKSKFPAPNDNLKTFENNCNQSKTDSPVFDIRNSEFDIRNSEFDDSAESKTASTPPVITLQLNTGAEYPILQPFVDEMQELYPAVDVMQELRSMKAWCIANPQKRKTKSGIVRFVNSWLSREQNKGGIKPQVQKNAQGNSTSVGWAESNAPTREDILRGKKLLEKIRRE